MRSVDAPPPPPKAMPELAVSPPEPESGMARVFISTDVPARVVHVSIARPSWRRATVEDLLCETTPCAVTLPYGDHDVAFTGTNDSSRRGKATIRVRSPTEVVNHSLGVTKRTAAEIAGGLVFVAGLVLVTFAAVSAAAKKTEVDIPEVGVGGAGAIAGGIALMALFPGIRQESATTQWSPAREGRTVGAALGVAF